MQVSCCNVVGFKVAIITCFLWSQFIQATTTRWFFSLAYGLFCAQIHGIMMLFARFSQTQPQNAQMSNDTLVQLGRYPPDNPRLSGRYPRVITPITYGLPLDNLWITYVIGMYGGIPPDNPFCIFEPPGIWKVPISVCWS